MSRLNEQQRRWYAAIVALRVGHGGVRLASQISGISEKTIRRGRKESEVKRPAEHLSYQPYSSTRRHQSSSHPPG